VKPAFGAALESAAIAAILAFLGQDKILLDEQPPDSAAHHDF
jgi:hypothetical protein